MRVWAGGPRRASWPFLRNMADYSLETVALRATLAGKVCFKNMIQGGNQSRW